MMPGPADVLADRFAALVARRAGAILAAALLGAAACALLAVSLGRGPEAGASELVIVVRSDPQDDATRRRAAACASDIAAELSPVQQEATLESPRLAPLPRFRAWIREAIDAQAVLESGSPGELMKRLTDGIEQAAVPERGDLDRLARLVWAVYDGWTEPSQLDEAFDGLLPDSATATQRHLEAPDGRLLFVVAPRGSVPAARRAIEAVSARHPGVEVAPAAGDLPGAAGGSGQVAALALVSVILVVAFRGVVAPLLVLAALFAGAAWTLPFADVMGITAGLGLGLQCGVMLAATLARARRDSPGGSGDDEAALRQALRVSGPAIAAAAAAASAGFAVAALAGGEGLARPAAVACAASILCAAAVLAVVPAGLRLLVFTADARVLRATNGDRRVRVITVAAISLAAAGLAAIACAGGRADGDGGGASIPYAESVAGSLDEAQVRAELFVSMETVLGVGALGVPICEREQEKIDLAREARQEIGPLIAQAIEGPDPPLSKLSATVLATQLKRLGQILDAAQAKSESPPAVAEAIGGLRQAVREMQEIMRPAVPQERLSRMIPVDRAYLAMRRRLAAHLDVLLDDAPLQAPAGAATADLRLRVYPRPPEGARLGDPMTPQAMRRFVGELKSVDPAIGGPAVQAQARGGASGIAWAAAIAAGFVIVLASARSVPDAATAMVPAMLGAGAGLVIGRLCGESGPAAVLALPVVVGTAVAAGAQVVLRARAGPDGGRPGVPGAGVLAAGLCVAAGFAAIAVAGSGTLAAAGAVVAAGTGVVTVAGVIALPAWLARRG